MLQIIQLYRGYGSSRAPTDAPHELLGSCLLFHVCLVADAVLRCLSALPFDTRGENQRPCDDERDDRSSFHSHVTMSTSCVGVPTGGSLTRPFEHPRAETRSTSVWANRTGRPLATVTARADFALRLSSILPTLGCFATYTGHIHQLIPRLSP